jgi:hypothetical protein
VKRKALRAFITSNTSTDETSVHLCTFSCQGGAGIEAGQQM